MPTRRRSRRRRACRRPARRRGASEHAAAVGTAVGGRDRVADDLDAGAVHVEREPSPASTPPAPSVRRTRRRAGRGAGTRSRCGSPPSRSRSWRCRGSRAPFASPTSTWRVSPAGDDAGGLLDVVGDAEDAREVVAAAAGDHSHGHPGVGELAAHLADEPVAAHHDHPLASLGRSSRLVPAVGEALRHHAAEGDPAVARAPPRAMSSSLRVRPPPAEGLTSRTWGAPSTRAQSRGLERGVGLAAHPVRARLGRRRLRAPRRRRFANPRLSTECGV